MIVINHHYSLTPEWQDEVIQQTNAQHINNEITIVPKNLGKGKIFFTQVLPGLSVHLLDMIFSKEITINRYVSHQDLYILQYDISDKANQLIINDTCYDVGPKSDIALAVIDNKVPSTFIPVVGQRIFALRITVDKKFMHLQINDKTTIQTLTKNLFYNNYIDSESKILLHSLKDKSVSDASYSAFLKGVSLKIFANFLNSYQNQNLIKNEVVKPDSDAINKTIDYLLKNLNAPFPSIIFLSQMAGMSATKYKATFVKVHGITPNKYFIKEKMLFANKLLTSENFSSVTEISQLLSYSKISYFASQYFEIFGHKPYYDFRKSNAHSSLELPHY